MAEMIAAWRSSKMQKFMDRRCRRPNSRSSQLSTAELVASIRGWLAAVDASMSFVCFWNWNWQWFSTGCHTGRRFDRLHTQRLIHQQIVNLQKALLESFFNRVDITAHPPGQFESTLALSTLATLSHYWWLNRMSWMILARAKSITMRWRYCYDHIRSNPSAVRDWQVKNTPTWSCGVQVKLTD